MKNKILKFRYATDKDKDYFANILLDDYDAKIKLNLIGAQEKLEWKSDKWNVYIVGEINGKAIGFTCTSSYSDRLMNRINDFYIVKEYRSQGYGLQFLQYAENFAYKNWGAKGIDALTIDNIKMERLLIKRCFIFYGEYKDFYCREDKYYSQKLWVKLYGK